MVTDEELIQWMDEGLIDVDLENGDVWVRGKQIKPQYIGSDSAHEGHRRWTYGLRIDGRRRTIVRAKIVYLFGSRKPVPQGFEIHHLDEDHQNDAWSNLIMLTTEDHKKIHNTITGEVPF